MLAGLVERITEPQPGANVLPLVRGAG